MRRQVIGSRHIRQWSRMRLLVLYSNPLELPQERGIPGWVQPRIALRPRCIPAEWEAHRILRWMQQRVESPLAHQPGEERSVGLALFGVRR
jgi:hypothetical protein